MSTVEIRPSRAFGDIAAPPSKSISHRALICAALSKGVSCVFPTELSEDVMATLSCVRGLGCSYERKDTCIIVKGSDSVFNIADDSIFDCGESGSTLRFFLPLAMISGRRVRFTGSEVLLGRPLSVYEEIFRSRGIRLERRGNFIEAEGCLHSGAFTVPANVSSQFVSGLLFALPLLNGNSIIFLTKTIESGPYIDMTLQVQRAFGINIKRPDERTFFIPGSQAYACKNYAVEGDYSNAAFFAALNCLGGNVKIGGLDENSLQGDRVYQKHFKALEKGFAEIDISDCPDLGPVLFVLAAAKNGGEFTGTRRLRIKESDRGMAMCSELSKFGTETFQEENRIVIRKGKLVKPSVPLSGHNDHRIVMALSVLMTLTGGIIEGADAVNKSFLGFFSKLGSLGIDFNET